MAKGVYSATKSATYQAQRRSIWQRIAKHWYLYLLLVPTFALLAVFSYYATGLAIVESFFDWRPGSSNKFVGLLNYRRILADRAFWMSWRNMGWIVLWTFTVPFAMPIIVAEAIFNLRSRRAKAFYRIAILIPILVPGLVSLQLWKWLYAFPSGGINLLLGAVGLEELARSWLGNRNTALAALLFMGFPWIVGISPLIYLAGLLNIPSDVLDAAKIDGSSLWRRIISIDIPHILGQVRLFLILGIIDVVQGFGAQLVLTQGGPFGATTVPGWYLYTKAFPIASRGTGSHSLVALGQACAVGVMLFIIILCLSFVANRRLRISGIAHE